MTDNVPLFTTLSDGSLHLVDRFFFVYGFLLEKEARCALRMMTHAALLARYCRPHCAHSSQSVMGIEHIFCKVRMPMRPDGSHSLLGHLIIPIRFAFMQWLYSPTYTLALKELPF